MRRLIEKVKVFSQQAVEGPEAGRACLQLARDCRGIRGIVAEMKKARIHDWVRVLLLLFSVRQIVYSFGIDVELMPK